MFHSGMVTQSLNSYSTAVVWWDACWWCPGTSMKLTSEWWWRSNEVKWYWISISCWSRKPVLELMLSLVYVLWVAISEHCRHYWGVLYPGETWLLEDECLPDHITDPTVILQSQFLMVILTTSQLKQILEMMYVVNITFFKDKQKVDLTWLGTVLTNTEASLVAQTAMQETGFWPLGQEDPLEKGMTTHFSILAWRIPWTEEPRRLQSMGSQRLGHDWATNTCVLSPGLLPLYLFMSYISISCVQGCVMFRAWSKCML